MATVMFSKASVWAANILLCSLLTNSKVRPRMISTINAFPRIITPFFTFVTSLINSLVFSIYHENIENHIYKKCTTEVTLEIFIGTVPLHHESI